MVSGAVFTKEEGDVIRPEDAAAYYRSSLGVRMLSGASVRREWGFNLFRPERNQLIQGVVDCAFLEDDGWVLVDYKTDRAEDTEAFREMYRPQLKSLLLPSDGGTEKSSPFSGCLYLSLQRTRSVSWLHNNPFRRDISTFSLRQRSRSDRPRRNSWIFPGT